MICFFDCETTGLPKNWKAPMSELDNWPRVIQLAWLITDHDGKELSRGKHLIKPDGWIMPREQFWIDHAFSHDASILNGKPIAEVLQIFVEEINTCTSLVSHNMSFDYDVVGAEMMRQEMKSTAKLRKICTKEVGTDICKLPGNYGKYKWPKLSELYRYLFVKDFENAHDALGDVMACKECFFELVKLGVITIETKQIPQL